MALRLQTGKESEAGGLSTIDAVESDACRVLCNFVGARKIGRGLEFGSMIEAVAYPAMVVTGVVKVRRLGQRNG